MNQILMTETPKQNNKKKKESSYVGSSASIVRFFAIVILIFGLALSGDGAYALVKNENDKANTKVPTVTTKRVGNSVTIDISNEVGIRTVVYYWNDSNETSVSGKNLSQFSQTITIPTGDNKLYIEVTDSNGKVVKYVKNFIKSEEDTTKPVIDFDTSEASLKLIVTDDTALDKVIYKLGDNEEQTVEASEDNPTEIDINITITEGEQTLKVQAIDKSQNVATATQQVKGAVKAKIEITSNPDDISYLDLKVTDNDGVKMVAIYVTNSELNNQEYKTNPNTTLGNEFSYSIKLVHGANTIKVIAYNINEQITEFEQEYNYLGN